MMRTSRRPSSPGTRVGLPSRTQRREVVHLGGELIDVGEHERLAVAAEALDAVVVERRLEAELAAVGRDVDAG